MDGSRFASSLDAALLYGLAWERDVMFSAVETVSLEEALYGLGLCSRIDGVFRLDVLDGEMCD